MRYVEDMVGVWVRVVVGELHDLSTQNLSVLFVAGKTGHRSTHLPVFAQA